MTNTKKAMAGVTTEITGDKSEKLNPMMTAHEVMQILQVSRPTLRKYARQGLLNEVRLSERNIRFCFNQVQ